MPIVKCECKECKFCDDSLCCKDAVELKTYGQCVEGIKIELNQALEEQKMAMDRAIARQKAELDKAIQEQMVADVPYYNYNIHLGGRDL